jgi:hypothetical protein
MTCMKSSVTKGNALLQQVLQYYSNTCIAIMKGIKLAKIYLSSRKIVTNAISIQPFTYHICKLCETWIRDLSAGNHGMQIYSFAINYFHVFLCLQGIQQFYQKGKMVPFYILYPEESITGLLG